MTTTTTTTEAEPMNFTVKKTHLSATRTGYCGSGNANNCYYTGQSTCWEILCDGEPVLTLHTKRDAVRIVEYLERVQNIDNDIVMGYLDDCLKRADDASTVAERNNLWKHYNEYRGEA